MKLRGGNRRKNDESACEMGKHRPQKGLFQSDSAYADGCCRENCVNSGHGNNKFYSTGQRISFRSQKRGTNRIDGDIHQDQEKDDCAAGLIKVWCSSV